MAAKKSTTVEVKMTPTQLRKENEELKEQVRAYKEDYAWCYMCGKPKKKDRFYKNTNPLIRSGITAICKDCAEDIALRKDSKGEYHEPIKESVRLALQYLDKPFLEKLYTASINESENENTGKKKSNVWNAYIKNVSMTQYIGRTYKDSDGLQYTQEIDVPQTEDEMTETHKGQDTYTDYTKNKNDVIRLLSYDPFEKEAISDQPFLYSQLLGLLDASEDANEDMMRTASAITIVRGFLQQSKIDNTIANLMTDIQALQKNSATIKSLQDSKKSITGIIKDLAAESCISLKNNKNAKKGENTWTGKLKKIKDMNLREGEVNGFDIGTCRGMRQVMDMSNASILKQLRLDESEYSDMIAEMRETIVKLRDELNSYKEISRILLRENIDLKDFLDENDIDITMSLVDLNDLFSCFSSTEESEGESNDESESNEDFEDESEHTET